MKNCPKCGAPLHEELGRCLVCDWVDKNKKKKLKQCPRCGDVLVKGVCYKCGYRKRFSKDTCPYCKEKLVGGRCQRCDYIKPSSFLKGKLFGLIEIIIIIVLVGLAISYFRSGGNGTS